MRANRTIGKHFAIRNHGTLVEFKPLTDDALGWWVDNVDPNCSSMGQGELKSFFVEHRFAPDLLEGIYSELTSN